MTALTRSARTSDNSGVRRSFLRRGSAILAIPALLASACDLNLPSERDIEDLRVLDLKVDPPEITLFERGSLELDPMSPPPFERTEVTVRALVAHPDLDATFGYQWVRCKPGLGSIPCEVEDGETREVLGTSTTAGFAYIPVDLVLADVVGGQTPLENLAARFVEDPRDLLNGLYTYINTQVSVLSAGITVDTTALEAVKRVVVFEPRLVARAIREAQALDPSQVPMIEGLPLPSLCTNVSEGQVERLFTFLSTRTPNRSPVYDRVEIEIVGTSSSATRSVGLGEVLELDTSEALVMRGWSNTGDAEKYQLIDADCALQSFQERLAFSWFTQAGELDGNVTTDEEPLIVWYPTREDEAPATEPFRARIWTVLRDGRGGSDHRWFDVRVTPAR